MTTRHLLGFVKSVCFIWVGCSMYLETNSGVLYCTIARFQRVFFFGEGGMGTIVKAQLIFVEVQLIFIYYYKGPQLF